VRTSTFVAIRPARFSVVWICKTLCYFCGVKVLQSNGLTRVVSSPSFRRSSFGLGPSHPFAYYTEFHTDTFPGDVTFITTLADGSDVAYRYAVGNSDTALVLYYAIQSYYGVPINGATGGYAFNRYLRDSFPCTKIPYP